MVNYVKTVRARLYMFISQHKQKNKRTNIIIKKRVKNCPSQLPDTILCKYLIYSIMNIFWRSILVQIFDLAQNDSDFFFLISETNFFFFYIEISETNLFNCISGRATCSSWPSQSCQIVVATRKKKRKKVEHDLAYKYTTFSSSDLDRQSDFY